MTTSLIALLVTELVIAGNHPPLRPDRPTCPDHPIKLAYYEYGQLYDNGEGIDKDVVDEIAKRSGCEITTRVAARARIWNDLESGELHMSVSGIRTTQRDAFAWFAPYLSIKNHAVLGPKASKSVHSADDFIATPHLVFGIVRSFKHGTDQDRWIEILRGQGRVEESTDAPTLYQKLKNGRVDAIFSQPPVYTKYIKDLAIENRTTVQDWTPREKGVPHGLILAKSTFPENQARKWQALVDRMHADGTLRKIFLRRMSAKLADQLLDF